ncbi:MAG TPA: phytanoyl-CoA dioxygenase family protein [Acetobacteraceae bacterium]|nr:phytanoyl-CoA dioxygenase family protein [Acetobacteraceae bacterium]
MNEMAQIADMFDEEFYLGAYPDVRAAIEAGIFASGYAHFQLHGRAEGRPGAPPFDAAWYQSAYPWAVRDVEIGRARDFWQHYHKMGRHRGYLPNRSAKRPATSRSHGLWTDRADAADVIAGRLSLGTLNESDAAMLMHWLEFGFLLLPQVIPETLLDTASAELDLAFQGGIADLLFDCGAVAPGNIAWSPALAAKPAKALDLHYFSEPLRELMFAPGIVYFLNLLFERKPLVCQSLAMERGTSEALHQDTAFVAFSQALRFVGARVALEDSAQGASELIYYPGSHRLADFLFDGAYKSMHEAMRMRRDDSDGPSLTAQAEQHVHIQTDRAEKAGIMQRSLIARRGDVVLMHADLLYGDRVADNQARNRTIISHYCPSDIAPCSFESGRAAIHRHHDAGYFSSVVY